MSKSRIRSAVEADSEKLASKARENLHELGEKADQYYEEGLEKAQEFGQRLEDLIREKPLRSMLVTGAVAAGIGLLVGCLTRK